MFTGVYRSLVVTHVSPFKDTTTRRNAPQIDARFFCPARLIRHARYLCFQPGLVMISLKMGSALWEMPQARLRFLLAGSPFFLLLDEKSHLWRKKLHRTLCSVPISGRLLIQQVVSIIGRGKVCCIVAINGEIARLIVLNNPDGQFIVLSDDPFRSVV